jgi:RNA polymerase sigma factor (sigma-70 family)
LTAIRALPARQREALVLWSRHQMTLTELGEALGVSHVAARKLLRKAQDKLRAIMDRWDRL